MGALGDDADIAAGDSEALTDTEPANHRKVWLGAAGESLAGLCLLFQTGRYFSATSVFSQLRDINYWNEGLAADTFSTIICTGRRLKLVENDRNGFPHVQQDGIAAAGRLKVID